MTHTKQLEEHIAALQKELEEEKHRADSLAGLLDQTRLTSGVVTGDPAVSSSINFSPSRLWSHISHEILTPMDAILGMTDLVLETELSEDQRNYLEMINASADRLFSVVGDIIDYSEMVEGKLRQDLVNFDLFEAMQYDLYVAELSAKHKDITFSFSFAKDIPGLLNSDPGRLRQVLNNLLSNALQCTEKGSVHLKVEKDRDDGNRRLILRFTVEDTGPGLSREEQQGIFLTPVQPAFSGGEEKFSEVGLGMVVSHLMVKLFGGEMGVKSSQGKGASFWFTWPFIDPVEAYMGELPEDLFTSHGGRRSNLQGAKLLLAEDEHINGMITKAFLEQEGAEVTVVENGLEAVKSLEKNDYHAVLMDVQMPVMDGIEATMEIRKRERKQGFWCPIIALTAHALQGDKERCLLAGMDDYLTKPLDRDQLVQMLSSYLTKKVLVVGSDPDLQHEIIKPLVEQGWSVTIAQTARLAMYEASLKHFDLIIIDASLGQKGGLEAVQTIRQIERFSGCRSTIVGLGFSSNDEGQAYKEVGVDTFAMVDTFKEMMAKV